MQYAIKRMDELDRKILAVVQRDNQLPAAAIARAVGLSASAVQRRLKRLRETKVIERDVACVSPEAVGRHFLAIVSLTIEGEAVALRRQFARLVEELPEVMQCCYVTGEWDFFLLVSARDVVDYNALMERLVEQFPPIKRFATNVIMERTKWGVGVACG